jgi:recombination DNA repair RAD52 pathway protein
LRSNHDGVTDETKNRIQTFYDGLFQSIDNFTDIFKVDATVTQSSTFKENMDIRLSREIQEWNNQAKPVINDGGASYGVETVVVQKEKVKISNLIMDKTLKTEEDVDKLLHSLSVKLKQIIRSNKQIEFVE